MTILTIPLTCCKTCPSVDYTDLEWTSPPSPYVENECIVKYESEKDIVYMPKWYWIDIVEYISDIEKNIEIISALQK